MPGPGHICFLPKRPWVSRAVRRREWSVTEPLDTPARVADLSRIPEQHGPLTPADMSVWDIDATLLLVEDDAGDALLVEEMLTDSDLDAPLTWCKTLAEARQFLLACRTPVCVLLDLHLPDVNGPDAVHAARRIGAGRRDRRADGHGRVRDRTVRGGARRPGLPREGPDRSRVPEPCRPLRPPAQERRAFGRRHADEQTDRAGERPARTRPAAHSAAAGRQLPGRRPLRGRTRPRTAQR